MQFFVIQANHKELQIRDNDSFSLGDDLSPMWLADFAAPYFENKYAFLLNNVGDTRPTYPEQHKVPTMLFTSRGLAQKTIDDVWKKFETVAKQIEMGYSARAYAPYIEAIRSGALILTVEKMTINGDRAMRVYEESRSFERSLYK